MNQYKENKCQFGYFKNVKFHPDILWADVSITRTRCIG